MILEDQEINDAAEAFQNLAGDGDLDQQSGLIEVDRSEPLHPVIRFRADRLPKSGGGAAVPGMALFAYDADTNTIAGGAICLARRYYQVNSFTVTTPGAHRIKVTMGSKFAATIEAGDGFAAPTSQYSYIPLYTFDTNLAVIEDWRGAPCVQAWED